MCMRFLISWLNLNEEPNSSLAVELIYFVKKKLNKAVTSLSIFMFLNAEFYKKKKRDRVESSNIMKLLFKKIKQKRIVISTPTVFFLCSPSSLGWRFIYNHFRIVMLPSARV